MCRRESGGRPLKAVHLPLDARRIFMDMLPYHFSHHPAVAYALFSYFVWPMGQLRRAQEYIGDAHQKPHWPSSYCILETVTVWIVVWECCWEFVFPAFYDYNTLWRQLFHNGCFIAISLCFHFMLWHLSFLFLSLLSYFLTSLFLRHTSRCHLKCTR